LLLDEVLGEVLVSGVMDWLLGAIVCLVVSVVAADECSVVLRIGIARIEGVAG
jgi:hypothetical protein